MAVADKKIIEVAINEMTTITGQKLLQQFLVKILLISSCVRKCLLVYGYFTS
jgi:hypothetical protein